MDTLVQHVDTASEAIRAANHATLRDPLDAIEAWLVVGGLAELAGRLPQLLDYLSRSLRRADPTDFDDDSGRDPAEALAVADLALSTASAWAANTTRHLDAAHNQLGRLGRHDLED